MVLIERITNTDVIMASASAFAMNAEGFTPCVVAAAFFSPRRVPACCSCHVCQSRWAWAGTHFLHVYRPSEPQTRMWGGDFQTLACHFGRSPYDKESNPQPLALYNVLNMHLHCHRHHTGNNRHISHCRAHRNMHSPDETRRVRV